MQKLTDVVSRIMPQPSMTVNGVEFPIPISCHLSTVYWLFQCAYYRKPTGDDLARVYDNNPSGFVTHLLSKGQPFTKKSGGLTPNSVLVFVKNGTAQHSCIAMSETQISGYNQTGWFSSNGVSHQYSEHLVSHIRWQRFSNTEVNILNGGGFNLVQIDGETALNELRDHKALTEKVKIRGVQLVT